MNVANTLTVATVALFAVACVDNAEYIAALQDAAAEADLTLRDAISIAESGGDNGVGVRAALLVDGTPEFSIICVSTAATSDVRVDHVSGEVLRVTEIGSGSTDSCADAISLDNALEIAEGEVGGEAVVVVPDDDVVCAREIQVLVGNELWEVKVASDGDVLEVEESDEDGTDDD